uniref:Uncharacterized protein n=1 Tax=Anguilla anguilla TaxID=7936 RepID=A0A0E9S8T3_ANGAN
MYMFRCIYYHIIVGIFKSIGYCYLQ